MLERVQISEGRLLVGYPPLEYQLFENGEPCSENFFFRGHAGMEGNRLRIATGPSDVEPRDFTVSETPTESSTQFVAGFERGMNQKRRRWPNRDSVGIHFVNGWIRAWQERGRAPWEG